MKSKVRISWTGCESANCTCISHAFSWFQTFEYACNRCHVDETAQIWFCTLEVSCQYKHILKAVTALLIQKVAALSPICAKLNVSRGRSPT